MRKLKVAILVIDSNEYTCSGLADCLTPPPVVHPALQTLFDGLRDRQDIECYVIYGNRSLEELTERVEGAVRYIGIPYRPIPFFRMGGAYLARLVALLRFVRKLKPDLVHAQGTEAESGMVAVHSGFPSILTLHGNFRMLKAMFHPKPGSYVWLNAFLETHVLKRVHGIFCISRYVQEITKEFGKKQFLIPNPVRPEFLSVPRPRQMESVRRVCCMGTLDSRKRPLFILHACIPLWRRGMEFSLYIYGVCNGPYYEALRQEAEEWVKNGKVYFEGFIKNPLDAILHSDIMVSASLEESFGMNVLEAMAAGTPVVAPRVGGIVDIIEDGVSGLLYDAHDLENCIEQIRRLLEDNRLWTQISENGRQRAARLFPAEMVVEQTVNAYKAMVQANL